MLSNLTYASHQQNNSALARLTGHIDAKQIKSAIANFVRPGNRAASDTSPRTHFPHSGSS